MSYCAFKPGDELVALDDGGDAPTVPKLVVGRVYTCLAVDPDVDTCGECEVGIDLADFGVLSVAYCPCSFRKVQRPKTDLSIEAFSVIKPWQFEEPKRAPAPKRESVS